MKTDRNRVEEISSIILLSEVRGLGPVRFREIHEKFGSFGKFLNYVSESIESLVDTRAIEKMLGKKVWSKLIHHLGETKKKEFERTAWDQLRKARELNGRLITYFDELYPERLYHTNQSIPIIYAIGDVNALRSKKLCAVVGTRNPSDWTVFETQKLVKKLVEDGYAVVSGLATGIDAISHKTALDNNGQTIAVMGCGPDVYYPRKNRNLQDRIRNSGLIVSEYPFGSEITGLALKKRNKIIVGLSDVAIITETSFKGGTMNSYLAAVEQGKPVKVFLPISNVGGDFTGNVKVYNDQRIMVDRIETGKEPTLDSLQDLRAVIFDLDGTIWDSRNAMILALETILEEKRTKIDEMKVKKMISSLESPYTVLRSCGISNTARFWRQYRNNYSKVELFSESTKDVLSSIAESGKKLGVVTTLKGKVASELLQNFGLKSIFSVVISPSQTRARKPSPKPILKAIGQLKAQEKNTIYIGDNDVDILAAKAAGCLAGLAAWNRSISISEKPDYIFTSFEDLLLFSK